MGLISKFGKEKADKLKKENVLEHNEIFAKMLDIKVNNIFYGNIKYEENFKQKLSTKFYNIGINSGSGGRWESKKLSIEHTIALIYKLLSKKINDKDVCIYLLGGEDEKERNMMINNRFENENRVKYLGEFKILEFAALIKNLDYLISSDSLALHLAIAQKNKKFKFLCSNICSRNRNFWNRDKDTIDSR
jgi:heptosyltransferase-2